MPVLDTAAAKVPPHLWFAVSAIFHYLGPAFAVLLFPAVGVFGVAWVRIASAALIFAPFTRPCPHHQSLPTAARVCCSSALGVTLAAMNLSLLSRARPPADEPGGRHGVS